MCDRIVVVGTSLGGLTALQVLLSSLPAGFSAPIAIVQHRSVDSQDGMLTFLRRYTPLPVREPKDKEPVVSGQVYIAPPDYHLMIEGASFSLSTDAPVSYARPSIDVLFESAADAYGERTVGIVMTGANHDGAAGAARIKTAGGIVLVQDPATAECAIMPKAAMKATVVDGVLPLQHISEKLVNLCQSGSETSHAA
jgi:two-component system, chemotaxis family, protein-glutamate methylesterase/glutaminase